VTEDPPITHRIDGTPALVVHDWGGTGTPVLLAHPTGFHGRTWSPVARGLADRGSRVWSFDFRGHGDSDRSPDGYRWSRFADDLEAVVDHLGLAEGALLGVGHSKGAAALLLLEARRPGTFAQLWCYEPIVFPTDDELPRDPDTPMAVAARKRRAAWSTKEDARAGFASRPPLDVLDPEALDAYVDHGLTEASHGMVGLKCRPEDEAEVYAEMTANRVYPSLPGVRCPTLVVCGEQTDAIVPKLGRMVVDRLPAGRLEIMEGAGHFGPMQHPGATIESIAGFTQP
jgi:pimeloyl-ACP methyl ester carboxylesterase